MIPNSIRVGWIKSTAEHRYGEMLFNCCREEAGGYLNARENAREQQVMRGPAVCVVRAKELKSDRNQTRKDRPSWPRARSRLHGLSSAPFNTPALPQPFEKL